jgi:oligopeptide/dipeptide ABC transporter ATP-binding protein
MSIGASIADTLRFHGIGDSRSRAEAAREMLETVGLSAAYFSGLPHEFSGGQCQRVGIARALVLKPKLVVLDEPVSALDVSIRAQILNLLRSLQNDFGLTYIFISHDLTIVRKFCDMMAVLYLGKMVEVGPSEAVSREPLHPYTRALIESIPTPDPHARKARDLAGIEGELPSSLTAFRGCPFVSRCTRKMARCSEAEPDLVDMGDGRKVACFLHSDAVVQESAA